MMEPVFLQAKKPVAKAANQVIENFQKNGFCYVKHDLLGASTLDMIKNRARWFYAHPMLPQWKEQCATNNAFRGYYQYLGASGPHDHIQCFSVGNEALQDVNQEEDPSRFRQKYFEQCGWPKDEFSSVIARKNAWPIPDDADPTKGCELFRKECLEYYFTCHHIAMDILRHVAVGLELPDPEFFVQGHTNADSSLELKFYPSSLQPSQPLKKATRKVLRGEVQQIVRGELEEEAEKPNVRLDVHADLTSVTLLAQDHMGGLEVLDENTGEYLVAPVVKDALLVNAGSFLEKWTNGVVAATPHRVRYVQPKDNEGRCSIVFFCWPNFDHRIEPLFEGDQTPFFAGDIQPMP